MSSIPDNSNIVSLHSRQPTAVPTSDRLGEPLQAIREITLKRLSTLIGALFDGVDDALFDRAEHTQAGAQQTEFFDGMRETRKKRQRAERLTLDRIGQLFVDFGLGRIQPPQAAPSRESAGLSLVDDSDLEEVLAISTLVTKSETRLSEPLSALCRRFSALRGGAVVENATNPIGPAQLTDAFRRGMDQLEISVSVRLIIYKLYERHVMAGVDALYDEVNGKLIEAGVLPQLRHAPAPAAPASATRRPDIVAQATALSPDSEYAAAAPGGIEAEIYQTLRSLLAMRHAPAPVSIDDFAVANAAPQTSLAPTELLSALQILQSQSVQMQARSAAESIPSGLGANYAALANAKQLKQALFDETDRMQAGPRARVAAVDEDTIDLVGMVFEFIVQDRNLPPQMQALLGRLQIPFLKVALLDRHLFTQKSHPARQLLDNMAQACIAEGGETDTALHNKIRDIVETILRDFDDDLGLIERAGDDFKQFQESARRRVELAEKRTTESIQGREKLDYARRLAALEMRQRCDNKILPELVRSLLGGPFAQYLVQIALRQGDKSVEWKQALGFSDALVWSTLAKTTDAERTRLKNLAPSMTKYLHDALVKVGWQETDAGDAVAELGAMFKRQLAPPDAPADIANETFAPLTRSGVVQAAPAREAPPTAIVGNLIGLMRKSALKHEEPQPEPAPAIAPAEDHVAQVKAMRVGTWVEFNHPDTGLKERAKLSWISPISAKYLFVDRKGLKVADKTVTDLAAAFAAGSITVLDDSMPLFDRAMTAVVERLKSVQPTPP